jgi:hypothetical protein
MAVRHPRQQALLALAHHLDLGPSPMIFKTGAVV